MPDQKLQLVPLGGLGEFGMNSMAIRYGDDIIVVDAGMMFPDAELLGVDIVTPDFAYLEQNREHVRALILTHGHEDHIGARAVPARARSTCRCTAPPSRWRWSSGASKSTDRSMKPSCTRSSPAHASNSARSQVEFIHVTHSIVSCVALAITTPLGVIIHTGDFKVDPTPTDNELFDLHTLADYGKRGVLLLLSDSTNVDRPGYTESERAVRPAPRGPLLSRRRRLVISCFSSSIHRLQQILDLSRRVRPQSGVSRPQHDERHRDRALHGTAQSARRHSAAPAGHHAGRSQQSGGGGVGHAGRADVGAVARRRRQSQESFGRARRYGGAERPHHSREREGHLPDDQPLRQARRGRDLRRHESAGARLRVTAAPKS